jgi:hypothetical protein
MLLNDSRFGATPEIDGYSANCAVFSGMKGYSAANKISWRVMDLWAVYLKG